MIIESKYNGKCATCGKPYAVKDWIEWSRETGTHHAECVPVDPVPTAEELEEMNALADRLLFLPNHQQHANANRRPKPRIR